MWNFTHPPRSQELAQRYDVHFTLPNICADELAAGSAAIGLVPVAALATNPNLLVIPGVAIASLEQVRSILLVTRKGVALEDLRSIALDSTSRASSALVRVLFRKFIGTEPRYTQHAPTLTAMMRQADAALLIGDPALLAREANVCGDYDCHDLAELWKRRTGLPFVFAVWAMPSEALAATGATAQQIARDFQQSRDSGLANIEALVAEWTPRIAISPRVIREYLSSNIHYSLDQECLSGLQLFFKYAAECGALPNLNALRFL